MRFYHLFFILFLLLLLFWGHVLIFPQKVFYEVSDYFLPSVDFPEVRIFSSYPFNNRGEISITAGARQGMIEGMSVTVDGRLLIGKVVKVFDNYSIVRTFFHSGWQIPVRVGQGEINALLEGGTTPQLTMIEKDKNFMTDEWVYSASQDFPYGLAIGKTRALSDSSTAVFKEAELDLPYNFNDLRILKILLP